MQAAGGPEKDGLPAAYPAYPAHPTQPAPAAYGPGQWNSVPPPTCYHNFVAEPAQPVVDAKGKVWGLGRCTLCCCYTVNVKVPAPTVRRCTACGLRVDAEGRVLPPQAP